MLELEFLLGCAPGVLSAVAARVPRPPKRREPAISGRWPVRSYGQRRRVPVSFGSHPRPGGQPFLQPGGSMRPYAFAAKLAGLTTLHRSERLSYRPRNIPTRTTAPHSSRFAPASSKLSSRATPRYSNKLPLPDVVVLPPNATTVHGRDASVEMMREFFSKNQAAYRIRRQRGPGEPQPGFRSWYLLPDRDSQGRRRAHRGQGKLLVVLRAKRDDGNWLQTRVIWTRD